ncbi:sulfotransferase family protein [Mycolicibacterium smegmatis]|uniref:sulfotransferase family protein n=1 Tax=Mycolicibacterium smegmatis TaxID=1772 RepID=UPI0005D73975|nr:sulfotransferase family protein [Mycolicibacterium smegmatis]MDF1897919.1 sulfotransferase family protein [Mycolicibacterium smegmatis]MDF1905054.1 sulfotransferase family protein [Mycolicibacterium smegmatis]MDF1916678.1 sulfotransferase family protein [Mycolicibacterium smegmatis]MDF1923388.1 sulfotransferase family protein [Mycolicibacterium smegmatis]UAK52660.1 sulfotransferase family protein [Mycolicibacterium smegmatis]
MTGNGTRTRPVILFVLGMGRSGSSALTRVLSLCGAALPTKMMGADKSNPRGYWEPRESLLLNRSILDRHGSAWWDPTLRLTEEEQYVGKERAACMAKIEPFIAKLPKSDVVVVKDLQIVVLYDMWFEAARAAGYDIAVVIPVRHPGEVASSLAAAAKAPPELTAGLWLKGNLLSERHTRDVPRVVVDYPNMIDDWRREVKRVSTALNVDLTPPDEQAVDDFLAPSLRRQRSEKPVIDRFGTDWLSTVYAVLRAAGRDEPIDTDTLDRVYEQFRVAEHDFRVMNEGNRHFQDGLLNKLVKPAVVRPILEVVAMAHRRRGTWA